MPIYTYRCENCGIQFDKTQKFSDSPLVRCPECNHKSLRKVYVPVGIVFKGKGFYSTDNRSPSGQTSWSSNHDEKSSSKTAEAKAEKAAEQKPAAPKSDSVE
ncbi:MAG: FmdB family zinc ribbon protein [Anaerolineaceae bacterium]|jgi:putative FmdB family regulatory protein